MDLLQLSSMEVERLKTVGMINYFNYNLYKCLMISSDVVNKNKVQNKRHVDT